MADTERELMGDATVGWSTQADSNGTSEYWCKIGPSTPYTVPEGATKCCILASGYGWTANYQLPTATGNAYYTPYGRCYVGINETGGQSSNLTGGTQKVCRFNISSYTGTTITPYAYSAERGDSGGAHPGTHSPKTTVYGVWFE